MSNKKKTARIIGYIVVGIIFAITVFLFVVCKWSKTVLNITLGEILFTMKSPLNGADTSLLTNGLIECLPWIISGIIAYVAWVFADNRLKVQMRLYFKFRALNFSVNLRRFARNLILILILISFVASVMYANVQYKIVDYIKSRFETTKIYEEYYIHPDDVNIRSDGDEKNLICIYLESMETTYASEEDGGAQTVNYMPNLTRLANENISFSNSDKLGGYKTVSGTHWTMGALFALTSGIPFAFPVDINSMSLYKNFAPNLTALGDVLDRFGYNQYFLCGSDAVFGGRRNYFEQHGNYNILDLYTAREKGYIPSDYFVWWGFEDMYLFEFAKDEIVKAYETGQPFNFTMLTVDTHFFDGYVCELCDNDYESIAANVISCADKQVQAFVDWCKEQPFYEDTLIVICGDHPRMDTPLVENVDYNNRSVYNCMINAPVTNGSKTNRVFTHMDMFPTVLYAIGFEFDGNRIALGTNMFSEQPTLAEELGFEYFCNEVGKHSSYYVNKFS